jgi:hypothetical protein
LWCFEKISRYQDLNKKLVFLKEVNVKDTNHFLEWSVGDREVACHFTRSVNIILLVPHSKALIFFDIVTCQGYFLG